MSNSRKISEILADRAAIDGAVHDGVRQALLRHKLLGESVVIWHGGQVVEVQASDIVVPETAPARRTESNSDAA